jgi:hypothetical protein
MKIQNRRQSFYENNFEETQKDDTSKLKNTIKDDGINIRNRFSYYWSGNLGDWLMKDRIKKNETKIPEDRVTDL